MMVDHVPALVLRNIGAGAREMCNNPVPKTVNAVRRFPAPLA